MLILWAILAAIGLSFWISFFATIVARRVAFRLGMLDVPARHKNHTDSTPLLGGSAIFGAILGPCLLGLALARIWASQGIPVWVPEEFARHVHGAASRAPQALGILLGAMILHITGLIDDKKNLGPWIKLIVQLSVAAGVVVYCNVRVLTLVGSVWSIILSILWLVLLINSFNFLDNMDGLAAGVAAICALALLAAACSVGQWFVTGWVCLILGALLGFLPHNFPPAKIYMGDAGSLVVGFLLGVATCLTTYTRPGQAYAMYAVFAPILLMAIPMYDTFSVIWIRIREGRHPMIGDRRHFSHRLMRRGMTTRTAVATIYLCTAGTAISASMLPHVHGVIPAVMMLAQTGFILMVISLLESTEK